MCICNQIFHFMNRYIYSFIVAKEITKFKFTLGCVYGRRYSTRIEYTICSCCPYLVLQSELKKVLTFNIANEIIGQGLDLHMFSHISLYGYNNSFLCTDFGLNLSYTFQNLHQYIHRSQHKKVNLLSYWGKNCKNCHMCAICYIYSYITDSFHVAFFFFCWMIEVLGFF